MTRLPTAQRKKLRHMLYQNLALVQRDTRSDQRYLLVDRDTLNVVQGTVVNRVTARNLSDRRDCMSYDPASSSNTQRVYRTLNDPNGSRS